MLENYTMSSIFCAVHQVLFGAKSRGMTWAWHVAHMRKMRAQYKILVVSRYT
jgi:hypothetical protein